MPGIVLRFRDLAGGCSARKSSQSDRSGPAERDYVIVRLKGAKGEAHWYAATVVACYRSKIYVREVGFEPTPSIEDQILSLAP